MKKYFISYVFQTPDDQGWGWSWGWMIVDTLFLDERGVVQAVELAKKKHGTEQVIPVSINAIDNPQAVQTVDVARKILS